MNGGGGRIALGIGVSDDMLESYIAKLEELNDVYAEPTFVLDKRLKAFTADEIAAVFPEATITAAGGNNGSYSAEDGSVYIYNGVPRLGFSITVR